MLKKSKITYKFNESNLAILCSKYSKIIKIGKDFTEQELEDIKRKHRKLPAQYYNECSLEILMQFIL